MTLQTMLSTQLVPVSGSVLISQDTQLRVFVLSNMRLLREALARVLKNHEGISFVRAEEFSLAAFAEIVDSAYDVLLVDPLNKGILYSSILHQLPNALPHLRIISIDMEANVDGLLAEIFAASSTYAE